MKHLKHFENTKFILPEGKNYWSVKNDEIYLSKQLDKIGCPENDKKRLISYLDIYDEKILFLGVEKQRTTRADYYMRYELDHQGKYFTDKKYEYNGTIKLSKEELEEVKIEKTANKYNL